LWYEIAVNYLGPIAYRETQVILKINGIQKTGYFDFLSDRSKKYNFSNLKA